MKLCHSPTSPYARKVTVTAKELGLFDQIEMFGSDSSNRFVGINPVTPLGKLPSLEVSPGVVLFDSIVICEYLNSLSDTVDLFPGSGLDHAKLMTLHALANGMTEACFQRRFDSTAMPEGEGSPSWCARLKVAMERSLDEMEARVAEFDGKLDIATIAIGCALGYHDLRFSFENWREGRPQLTAWYDKFSSRPSMMDTVPPAA
ncbi:MAG: glutathione S-transferase family protein [Sneathiella sp.]